MKRNLITGIAAVMIGTMSFASIGTAGENPRWESDYNAVALRQVTRYDRPALYTYAPHSDAHERSAVLVAIAGHLLLEGYRATGNRGWREHAEIAADSLLAHPDMNHDGKLGWGRYWPSGQAGGDGKGGYTTLYVGCELPPNRAYDDEIYDDARIADFLLSLYEVSHDRTYLEGGQQVIENTWNDGGTVYGDGFMYWKTIGACSRGWYVKNINMLMAVPMARLARLTHSQRILGRLKAMMNAELYDLHHTIAGLPAPNFGYYSLQTMRDHPVQGGFVKSAQITEPNGTVVCNPRSGAGRSCLAHLPIEARTIDLLRRILDSNDYGTMADIMTIMNAFRLADERVCGRAAQKSNQADGTACEAYYCELRRLDVRFDQLCHDQLAMAAVSPDVVLGLFWGK